MAKQPGRKLLVMIGDGAETETFSVLCGLTTKSMTINNNTIDVTTANCTAPGGQLWRESMTGIRSIAFSGNGRFEASASEKRMLAVAHGTGVEDEADAICNHQVIVPGLGTFQGAFHYDSCEYGGEIEDAVTYALTLSSAGVITFTAEA